jgi:hypothetical protein
LSRGAGSRGKTLQAHFAAMTFGRFGFVKTEEHLSSNM